MRERARRVSDALRVVFFFLEPAAWALLAHYVVWGALDADVHAHGGAVTSPPAPGHPMADLIGHAYGYGYVYGGVLWASYALCGAWFFRRVKVALREWLAYREVARVEDQIEGAVEAAGLV